MTTQGSEQKKRVKERKSFRKMKTSEFIKKNKIKGIKIRNLFKL